MSNHHCAPDSTEQLVADLGGDPSDGEHARLVGGLQALAHQGLREAVSVRHIRAAASAAADAHEHTGRTNMRPTPTGNLVRAASVAAVLLVATAGAAYAGVLPDPISDGVAQLAGSVSVAEFDDPAPAEDNTGTDPAGDSVSPSDQAPDEETAPKGDDGLGEDAEAGTGDDETSTKTDDGRPQLPAEVTAVLQAVRDFRAAAHEWKDCVRAADDAAAECGSAPSADSYGLTDDVIAGLPEKLVARVTRSVAAVSAKLACIESHLEDPEARRACFAEVSNEFGHSRGDQIRERRSGEEPSEQQRAERSKDRETQRDGETDRRDRRDRGNDRDIRTGQDAPSDRTPPERHGTDGGQRESRNG